MSADLSLVEAIDLYTTLNTKITSSGTRRLYHFAGEAYAKFLMRPAIVADLNDLTFSRFRQWRQESVAHNTVRGECCKLLALWRWCATGKRRWIDEPEVTAPQEQLVAPKALTQEELKRLWKAAGDYRYRIGPVPGNVYLMALLYVLWDSSERLGAVHKIAPENVDLKRLWLTVPPDIRKGGRLGRTYKIRPITGESIKALLRVYDGPTVFGAADLKTIWHCFGHLRIAAGLPGWVRPHTIRKSHASHLSALGGDARLSLGHASDATTIKHYIDPKIAGGSKSPADVLFDPGERSWWKRLMG